MDHQGKTACVVGGGPAGMAVAGGLGCRGWSVTVLEECWAGGDLKRSYPVDVTARGLRGLEACGFRPAEMGLVRFEGHAHCWSGSDRFEPLQQRGGLLGTRDAVVEALAEQTDRSRVRIERRRVERVDLERHTVDELGPFQLIVGADGKNSVVRAELARRGIVNVRERSGRIGETVYKSFRFQPPQCVKEGWLYLHPPTGAVFARCLDGGATALGIMPGGRGLESMPSRLRVVDSEYASAPLADAGGGFVVSDVAGPGWALVGDAAVSPAPAGQGLNHAFDAAAALCLALDAGLDATNFNRRRKPDEAAYAFFSEDSLSVRAASGLGAIFGLHLPGHRLKATALPYSHLTSLASLWTMLPPSPAPPAAENLRLQEQQ